MKKNDFYDAQIKVSGMFRRNEIEITQTIKQKNPQNNNKTM